MQREQQAATDRIAGRSVRLPPVPCRAERERQRAPAQAGLRREQRLNLGHVRGRDNLPAIPQDLVHGERA